MWKKTQSEFGMDIFLSSNHPQKMQNARQISTSSLFSEDIFGEILLRLPIKTLLQLKCVCKCWHTLISSSWFISAHLKRFSSDPDAHYMLVQTGGVNRLIPISNAGRFIRLIEPCRSDYPIVGSINGLVCLTTTNFHQLIYLWNPSINQFKLLPVKSQKNRKCHVSLGFGYELNSDDYKVVRIVNYYKCRPANTVVEVYSTKLESWKEVKIDAPLNMTNDNCDVIVEGFTYWIIRNMNEPHTTVLVSFDMRSERFNIIPVPQVLLTESYNFRGMNYHGSLALLAQDEFNNCLEVWMIESGSCAECVLQKKFIFDMDFYFSTHYWGLTSGDIVVENAPNMPFLFNLRTKQLRIIGTHCISSVFYYTESLVSIKGFKHVPSY